MSAMKRWTQDKTRQDKTRQATQYNWWSITSLSNMFFYCWRVYSSLGSYIYANKWSCFLRKMNEGIWYDIWYICNKDFWLRSFRIFANGLNVTSVKMIWYDNKEQNIISIFYKWRWEIRVCSLSSSLGSWTLQVIGIHDVWKTKIYWSILTSRNKSFVFFFIYSCKRIYNIFKI